MARDARRARTLCILAMRREKLARSMARWCWRRRRVRGRTCVHGERTNHRRLGGVHMTRYAEVLRVARRAARRDRERARGRRSLRGFAVAAEHEVRRLV